MKIYSSREVLRAFFKDGWYIKRQKGSHIQLVHNQKKGNVTVQHPRRTLDPKTVKSIFIQAEIEIREN